MRPNPKGCMFDSNHNDWYRANGFPEMEPDWTCPRCRTRKYYFPQMECVACGWSDKESFESVSLNPVETAFTDFLPAQTGYSSCSAATYIPDFGLLAATGATGCDFNEGVTPEVVEHFDERDRRATGVRDVAWKIARRLLGICGFIEEEERGV